MTIGGSLVYVAAMLMVVRRLARRSDTLRLVILNIGLDIGVLSPTVFTMMVLMALTTTFMTTPLLDRIYPAEYRQNFSAG
jgi:Kef-type K+ transport system membrane component KefB